MGQIGARELVVLAIIVLLVFGAKRLPDIARSLGKSARILKSETAAMKAENNTAAAPPKEEPEPATGTARTIQAAPGDVSTARPVEEPKPTAQT
ncbi:Sec-independent protein translocase subunit TatA [Streptomyces radicis]|uniref:Sec-independent protein translocase protein TatA n=1 Tax=Streptomyces radicis TaxID=1750517 RepID=A0A3A9W2U1_9ACTN|nr:Sec-independent protein translocase subunit TatA [Streptomyces radicis]RKN07230.1 Sec-independent protein translocase subunit TatA [Streptomyces radicis]RKN26752.1 Sec-independent protein translocase subunit TatA [Streptomyces radicis]